ncbi:hypothetical protein SAMN03159363_2015 [Variovorax sp. EL159]|nr:hypothetical protein SAMN03159363_2015 [Variovorax sp. EL159]
MKKMDPKALKILKAYDLLEPGRTSKEDFEYAKSAGMMFDPIKITHDKSVQWARNEFVQASREKVAASFLLGIGGNLSYARAALSAYAVMANFPEHNFKATEGVHCAICAQQKESTVDLTFINKCRWNGSLVGREPVVLALYLQQQNAEKTDLPAESDVKIFCSILDLISTCPSEETPKSLLKKIKKIPGLKLPGEEAKYLLDALGYAGILQTPEHKGFIYSYVGHLTPTKSRSSDWAYPVDFWTGSDGVNLDALMYWFKEYPEITQWRPS